MINIVLAAKTAQVGGSVNARQAWEKCDKHALIFMLVEDHNIWDPAYHGIRKYNSLSSVWINDKSTFE